MIIGIILLVAVFVIVQEQQKPRLSWKGKSAEYWISRLSYHDLDHGDVSAEEFLFGAGPDVVPELIRGLRRNDSWLHDRWCDAYFRLGKWQKYFQMPARRAQYRNNCATGLGLLGLAASNAVPELLEALKDNDSWVRQQAAESLGRIGFDKTRTVPALVSGLSSTNGRYRLACTIGLTHSLPGSAEAAMALRALLKDPDYNLRAWAAQSLWRDDSDREATFRVLLAALRDAHPSVRSLAALSLGIMNYKLQDSAEALRAALQSEILSGGDEGVMWKIIDSLAEIGPPAYSLVPVLTNLLIRPNSHTALLSLIALGRIEPDKVQWTEQLIGQLGQLKDGSATWAARELGNRGERARGAISALLKTVKEAQAGDYWTVEAMAAAAAWKLDPMAPNPFHSITNKLEQRNGGHYEIIRLLGELGPAARPAIPTLRQLRYSRSMMTHDYVDDALKRIAPEYLANPWHE